MLHTPWRQAAGFTSQIPRSLGKSWKSYVNPKLPKQELNFRGVSPAAVPTGMLLEGSGSPWSFWSCSWRSRGPPGPSGDANPTVPQAAFVQERCSTERCWQAMFLLLRERSPNYPMSMSARSSPSRNYPIDYFEEGRAVP